MLSFRLALLHKLSTIVNAEGSRYKAADSLGADRHSFNRWLRGENWPGLPFLERIDQRYLVAWEKLRIYGPAKRSSGRPWTVCVEPVKNCVDGV